MGQSSLHSKAARRAGIGMALALATGLATTGLATTGLATTGLATTGLATTGLATAGSPSAVDSEGGRGEDVGKLVQSLVEADWMDQDRRFQQAAPEVATEAAAEAPGQPRSAFSLEHTQAVLDRAARLAARLRPAESASLDSRKEELARLRKRVDARKADANLSESQRKDVYLQARRVARQIAFCNPLLDFDNILFVKRHDPAGLRLSNHMVHQFYGYASLPGGGLFVLSDPFSDHPRLTDLLADAVVENGRLAGRKLVPGAFLRPDVSYDGATVLFPYTEGLGEKPEWSPQACFHLFRVDASGGGLRQLTDGPWNDFDPCFLPDGRVALISDRRGGYLRCGHSAPQWPSPNFTLHSMGPDGSDMITLSYHESQEWGPSVNNDGMIVYTRWDYVDRDTDVAHHKWICYPDGRDPRAYHGNYPVRREDRPWMEMRIRAIPGSHRYVAVAAAHHGQEFGSLVLIDPRIEDDGALSQLTRLTPDVVFPEAETGRQNTRPTMVYGTPWPLGEEDYLVVYDADVENRGIYWLDADGNRELIYRDPAISCYAPMPLRPRPTPPVIPRQTVQAASDLAAAGGKAPPATVAVMNVYDSDFEWPRGTEVRALRVIHLLNKATSPSNKPRIGAADQTNARAILGTVPVEPDGSVFFEAPVGMPIYFQALDAEGMAVQSMRSATYLHPGERLVCQGCHERKHTASALVDRVPLALQRSPSAIMPEPSGSNPFSYAELVQPVLDRHCVDCHRDKEALDLSGVIEGPRGFSRSYTNLAEKYGFYFDSSLGSLDRPGRGGSRTDAGRFGARAARLMDFLGKEHYDVQLTDEERRRMIVWLDANSEFRGDYGDYQEP